MDTPSIAERLGSPLQPIRLPFSGRDELGQELRGQASRTVRPVSAVTRRAALPVAPGRSAKPDA